MIKIKICGITRTEDALISIKYGANALGFVFAESKRKITAEQCVNILKRVPSIINTVGVFRNNSKDYIKEVLSICPLSTLQFHGDEDEEFCLSFNRPVIKAFSVASSKDLEQINNFSQINTILIDGKNPGSGKTFDHNILSSIETDKYVILAGGLNPENISEILNNHKVFGVDVSSGVEKNYGIKDKNKIIDFINNVREIN